MRVVSLLPSATEVLCAAGGESMLVGRSHECDFPESITDRPILTRQRTTAATSAAIDEQVRAAVAEGRSLYALDTDLLRELRPDVILTQDLCDVCSIDLNTVRRAASEMDPRPEIISLDPRALEEVFDDVLRVGEAIGRAETARAQVVRLRGRYWEARDFVNPYDDGPEVAFLEWLDPMFVGGHWTPQLIGDAGGRHSLNAPGAKSRCVTASELIDVQPEFLIICPCGWSIERMRAEVDALIQQPWWRELPAVERNRVVMVDGSQMFNRPGPRLVEAFCWLVGWLNDRPNLVPQGFPVEALHAGIDR